MAIVSFSEKDIFFHRKISRYSPNYRQKYFSHWTSTDLEVWAENSAFVIIKEMEKTNLKCFPPWAN